MIKGIVSYSFVFYCSVYIFEIVCKIIDGKIYLLTYSPRCRKRRSLRRALKRVEKIAGLYIIETKDLGILLLK